MLRVRASPFPTEYVAALTWWFRSARSADALQAAVALGAGLPIPPPSSVLVGAWPVPPSSADPLVASSGQLVVFLTRLGPLRTGRSPLSGFIRATLASGRVLFQLRAPPLRVLRPLSELAQLACFLSSLPLMALRLVDLRSGQPLSLVPSLAELSWDPASPLLDAASLVTCGSVPPPCTSL